MVHWKSTLTVLGALALTVQAAAGCSLCPKGRWFDPKMVAPCPEANPKSQYFLGIEWPWCTASCAGAAQAPGSASEHEYVVMANRFVEPLIAPAGRHEIARGVSLWNHAPILREPQRGGMNCVLGNETAFVLYVPRSTIDAARASTLMSPRWGLASGEGFHQGLTPLAISCRPYGAKTQYEAFARNNANPDGKERPPMIRLVAFDELEEVQPRRVKPLPDRTDYDAPITTLRGTGATPSALSSPPLKTLAPQPTTAPSHPSSNLSTPTTTLRAPGTTNDSNNSVDANAPDTAVLEEVIIGRPVVPQTRPTSKPVPPPSSGARMPNLLDAGGESIDTPPPQAAATPEGATYPTQTEAPSLELNAPQGEPRITPEMLQGELGEGETLYMLDGQVLDDTLLRDGGVIMQGPVVDENGAEVDPRMLQDVQVDRTPLEGELPGGNGLDGWETTAPRVHRKSFPQAITQSVPESAPLDLQLREAETYYAMAVDADKQLDESAMNMYLDAALASYRYLESVPPQKNTSKGTARAWQVYHSSLGRLIFIADKNGCIDKETGIKLPVNGSYRVVEFEYINFQRTANDFDEWHVVGDYETDYLLTKHRQPGLGVPLVAVRTQKKGDRFFPARVPFAATAILRPDSELAVFDATTEAAIPAGTHVEQVVARLELFDPRVSGNVEFRCTEVPLAKDTSAPYALLLSETRSESKLSGLHPSRNLHKKGLFLMQPHSAGKIPVVFVHGLMSEPYIWASVANEIDGNPDLAARYEIWGFAYPGGMPFLDSAAVLREQLDMAVTEIDPSGFDRDLRNMVLVGHSMGGLLAKLQITDSGNTLWEHAAYQPLATLKTSPEVRDYLYRQFYFQKSPHVGRAVFIGTPHQGASHHSGMVSKHTAHLIHEDECMQDAHDQLARDNPAAFRKEMRHRFPNSLDLACSHSLLLKGIYRLPLPSDVPTHTILGSGWWSVHDGRSDGVVPVSSARLPGVQTEVMVTTKHTGLIRDAGGICELLRILRVHGTRPAFAGPPINVR